MNTMYSNNIYFPDVYKGCSHACVYCLPSFQRQAKRRKHQCAKCYTFEPHSHFERMKGKTPATKPGEFIFFPKGADLCFATPEEYTQIIDFIEANPQTTFLIQTKNPTFLRKKSRFPDNLIFGITLETNRASWMGDKLPSKYIFYEQISKAPVPVDRLCAFEGVKHSRKGVTIEPILKFDLDLLLMWLTDLQPEFIYIGYDTKNCKLPEPTLAETQQLIDHLKAIGFDVRLKTMRKAWYEGKKMGAPAMDCWFEKEVCI